VYGRLAQHGQSFDYTRRYQNDIVVYSENGLRAAMGNLKRGTRVVVANDIYVTKTINVNIQSESLLKTTNVDRREVIVAGFGGGSLRVKDNVSADFSLFSFGASEQSGIAFSNLYIEGFKNFIQCVPSSGAVYHADVSIKDCYLEGVEEAVSLESAGVVFFTRAKITNNRFINTDFHKSGTNTLTFLYSVISGNTFGSIAGSYIYMNSASFSDNITSGDMELNGTNSVVDGNVFRNVTFNAAAIKFVVTNNKFWQTKASIANGQGFVCRNNSDITTERDILTPGRVSIPGELIGQTVIDGVSTGFVCETASTTYKQLNDDTDASKKASVAFYVPANKKIVIRLNTALRDFDSSSGLFYIRLTDVNDETSPATFAAYINDEHIALYNATLFPIYTFEWFIDGNDSDINWTAGDLKTFYFQIKVQTTSETVSVRAGASYIPMNISAVGVSDDLNFVDMD
jgi:hypothetical protein